MSGPKRAPGHYRPARGWKGNSSVDLYLALPYLFVGTVYAFLKFELGWQWPGRVTAALWSGIARFIVGVLS